MIAEQLTTIAARALAFQAMALQGCAEAGLHGLSKMTHLNASMAKTSVEESAVMMKALMAAKDAGEASALARAQWAPGTAKALAYSRHLASIASSYQEELAHLTQKQLAQAREQLSGLATQAKDAPGEAESLQAMASLLENASQQHLQASEAARRSGEALQSSLDQALERWMDAANRAWSNAVSQGQRRQE